MKQLIIAERFFLAVHVISTLFGLAGLLIVLPNPQIIANLPSFGQAAFGWCNCGWSLRLPYSRMVGDSNIYDPGCILILG